MKLLKVIALISTIFISACTNNSVKGIFCSDEPCKVIDCQVNTFNDYIKEAQHTINLYSELRQLYISGIIQETEVEELFNFITIKWENSTICEFSNIKSVQSALKMQDDTN